MSIMITKVLSVLSVTILGIAQSAATSASILIAHEPKVPAKLQVKD